MPTSPSLIKPNASYDHHITIGTHAERMQGACREYGRPISLHRHAAVRGRNRRGVGHGVAEGLDGLRGVEGRLAGSLGTRALVERMLWRLEAEEARQRWHEVLLREQRRAQRFQLLEREEMLWRRERGEERMARPGGDRWVNGLWWLQGGELRGDAWGLGAGKRCTSS